MSERLVDLKNDIGPSQQLNSFYISFGDLMVMLCVFFVMLLGMSQIDVGRFEKIRTGFTGSTKGTLVELADRLEVLAKTQKGVSVRLAKDGVRVDLQSAALFDTGSAVLKASSLVGIEPILLEVLRTKYLIEVEGHTDDVPFYRRDGDEILTNWSLSGRRASAFVQHLTDLGFSHKRLKIVGYAATRPRVGVAGKTGRKLQRARALNRRVSLLVR